MDQIVEVVTYHNVQTPSGWLEKETQLRFLDGCNLFLIQWNPVNTDTNRTYHSIRINQVNFREMHEAFFRWDKWNCTLYMGVCIKRVSIERGSTVRNSDREQQIHKGMNSGEPKLSHCKSYRVLTCLYHHHHHPLAAEQSTTSFLYRWRSWAIPNRWLSFGKLSGSLRRQWG